MKFVYTTHVELRIRQRSLSRHDIEKTIENPDETVPSFLGREIARKKIGVKTLEVIHKKLNGSWVIITAYWLKEA